MAHTAAKQLVTAEIKRLHFSGLIQKFLPCSHWKRHSHLELLYMWYTYKWKSKLLYITNMFLIAHVLYSVSSADLLWSHIPHVTLLRWFERLQTDTNNGHYFTITEQAKFNQTCDLFLFVFHHHSSWPGFFKPCLRSRCRCPTGAIRGTLRTRDGRYCLTSMFPWWTVDNPADRGVLQNTYALSRMCFNSCSKIGFSMQEETRWYHELLARWLCFLKLSLLVQILLHLSSIKIKRRKQYWPILIFLFLCVQTDFISLINQPAAAKAGH